MDEEMEKGIKEANKIIREAINQWADIMLEFEARELAVHLDYFPRDLMNATYLFQHVASNIGIKAGNIDEQKAVEFGERLRQLIIDMTGYDPHEFWKVIMNRTNLTNLSKNYDRETENFRHDG